uniref:Uncharacterized protein n=1 Tax=Anopheles melas TaxID=34690 RepID=A0A182TXX1_9DIPT
MPDLLHIIPVGDDTVLDRVLQGEDTTLGLGLITDVRVLVAHTDHHTLVTGTANNGREDGTWGVITGESGLAHSGSVVNDKCSRIIITHLGWFLHLRWTIPGPPSSYSCFEIHIDWKVDSEARMDPPIQTEYLRSGGAMILILIVDGASEVISFCIRSAIPGYMVVPPDRTLLAYRSLRMSTSQRMMEL